MTTQRALLRSIAYCTSNDTTPCQLDNDFASPQDAHCTDMLHMTFALLSLLMGGASGSHQQVLALILSTGLLATIDPYHLIAVIETFGCTLVGWAPAFAAVDNRVCIFQGQPEMFVMRKASQRGCFTLIGDTFIPGFTPSEDVFADDGDDDWITIC